jgi:high-affinity iron transporter
VARLRRALPAQPITPLVYATRAHEILEDVQRDRLGSPTPSDDGVRATADGLAATREVLGTLAGLLAGRGDAQAQSQFWLRRLGATLAAIRAAHHGAYPRAARLTRSERERLDGDLGASLEALGGIPGELETQLPAMVRPIGR